jgi:hypothetical protein
MTAGEQVSYLLGIDDIKEAYIQQLLNFPYPVYLISIDSENPERLISRQRIQKSKSVSIRRGLGKKNFIPSLSLSGVANIKSKVIMSKPLKWTPPVSLRSWNGVINRNTLFIRRDLCGDYIFHYKNIKHENTKKIMIP